jgi:uncharacterized OsmC-like protein
MDGSMAAPEIAAALQRVESVLKRRPQAGLHDDAPASAHWQSGTRVLTSHANGTRLLTDMPTEFGGGGGGQVTPGWLMRAGLAACLATRIAMGAAAAGFELAALEVRAGSRSDTRGMLGMQEGLGEPVGAGPLEVQVVVRIAAPGVSMERLRVLVEECNRYSPVSAALRLAVPVSMRVEAAGE